ncbi:MAG: serine hydrolase domain-containing protein [Geminicoccaceae bacterium]
MQRSKRMWIIAFSMIPVVILIYLLATGERGLFGNPKISRTVDITRLDTAEADALGWDPAGLDAAFDHAASLSTDVLMIVTNGRTVGTMGDVTKPYRTHSMRKAFLSTLIGQHVGAAQGQIRLDATLNDLDIDDEPGSLTSGQRQATVLHLLKSMSGINHPAAAEAGLSDEKKKRLGDQENVPGTIWAYNNWDYNALTTIFEQRAGMTIADAFETGIARPLGMQDFQTTAVSYIEEPALSQHRAAAFLMTGRDLARFGQLFLDKGMAGDRRLLPESWIERITTDATPTGNEDPLRSGHSYLWWIPATDIGLPEGTFWAWGLGQQGIFIIPAWQTVIVHQYDTTAFLKRFISAIRNDGLKGDEALEDIAFSCLEKSNRTTEFCVQDRFILRPEFAKLLSLIAEARH